MYFRISLQRNFIKTYPEINPSGSPKFLPKIYGFKIIGMCGSRFKLRFDSKGFPLNEEDTRKVLKKKCPLRAGKCSTVR